jgi:hypothetical protein
MKRSLLLSTLAAFTLLAAVTVPAYAQATRTWVSGVGDDANPCSRTAPCKTFAGAISKTATGGEINVLDPGGFGGVTITKSITISSEGFEAGVLVSGTNAIIINALSTDVVVLRGLDIEGLGTGLSGIKVLAAGAVHVEKCTINHFTQNGIEFVPTSAAASTSQLHVSDSIIRDNNGASSGGIHIKPGANVTVKGSIENTQLRNNNVGIRLEDNSTVTAKNTTASGNVTAGFLAVSVGGAANLNLNSCVAAGNANGIKADNNTNAVIRIANCFIAGNTTAGLNGGGGRIFSFGNNFNADANVGGVPTLPNIAPQ